MRHRRKRVPAAVIDQQQRSEYSEGAKCARCLNGIKTIHEGLGICYACYCQNIQPITEKGYLKVLQSGSRCTIFRPGQKIMN